MEWVKGRGCLAAWPWESYCSRALVSLLGWGPYISVLSPSGVRMGSRIMGFVLLSGCDYPQY